MHHISLKTKLKTASLLRSLETKQEDWPIYITPAKKQMTHQLSQIRNEEIQINS